MTSKEIEVRSGVPRANIRYYESEGLLTPVRQKNGYREYSEADLAVLERIRLLRRLGVSIEDLRALRTGSAQLVPVLDRRLAALRGEQRILDRVEQVCGELRAEAPSFETLNAEKYLCALDAPASTGETPLPNLPETDALSLGCCPFRRFFARQFDWLLILCIILAMMALTGGNPAHANALAMNLSAWALLFLVEPLLLCLFGTTPGKALLGLRLEGTDGRRLSYGTAFWRMVWMAWHGLGLGIPIFHLVQLFRSFRRCMEGEAQPWDEDVAYEARSFRIRQTAAVLLAAALLLGAVDTAGRISQMPPHRGELTVAGFAENFNRQASYLDVAFERYLNEEGRWVERPGDGNYFFTVGGWDENNSGELPFTYTVENGRLTAVAISAEKRNVENWLNAPTRQMLIAVMAFVWAQEEAPLWGRARMDILKEVEERGLGNYTLHQAGVTITCRSEMRGFLVSDWALIPEEGEGNDLTFTFTMSLDK